MDQFFWWEEFVQRIERGTLRGNVTWVKTTGGWCGHVGSHAQTFNPAGAMRIWLDDEDTLTAVITIGTVHDLADSPTLTGRMVERLLACAHGCPCVWNEIKAALEKAGC